LCGIAGIVDLSERRPVPRGVLQRMADALVHRGPDEEGFLDRPGLGLASRRLSIIGLADGQQPIANENGRVVTVFNGELFEYPELRTQLEARGHHFATHCDTELVPHLWEDHQEGMFEYLRGQFALAVWDQDRQRLTLARDRFGICPLYWTRQSFGGGDWLLFASEVKALLASGLVPARPDIRGIDQVFNFFAVPGPVTCFQGIELLQPGHYLTIQLREPRKSASVTDRVYFAVNFPDRGDEDRGENPKKVLDDFEALLLQAVERRLRADVPVVSYLSGGIDSSAVVALASKARGNPIPTFNIKVLEPSMDESRAAALVSRQIGIDPVVVNCGAAEVVNTYPRLIHAAEAPVVDTSCTGILLLAQEVHRRGYKVALTGEGSDEWLAGYSWYKLNRLMTFLDVIPGLPLSRLARWGYGRLLGAPRGSWAHIRRMEQSSGGHTAFHNVYAYMSLSRLRFYSRSTQEALGDYLPYLEIEPNPARVRRWHPLNRALYWGARIHLPGHLLSLKGDRVGMHSSVEMRYPFLDEDVYAFLARLHPRWKLRGFWDKYILRRAGERWLPREIAWRPKGMFRAPLDSFFANNMPPYVDQLLCDESLRRTGYFDPASVDHWRQAFREMPKGRNARTSIELGLVAVIATQLWHHTFIESLADLPTAVAGSQFNGHYQPEVVHSL
jgi:asparagine synthase (glutamine-hydrolysing)